MRNLSHPIPAGTLVRYDSGSTALMRVADPHAGGYHGHQCCGGYTFASADRCREATPEDYKTWFECEKWRKP